MDSQQIQTSVDDLYGELKDLTSKIVAKKTTISSLRKSIDQTIAERDALNAEVGRISAEVKELKSKRDSLNAKVKEFKIKRDELQDAAAKKRETLTQTLEQTRKISEQLQGSMSDILAQIKRLEWFI